MKKSELTQLTQVIEHLVRKEVRKQLPTIIAETFQNMMGKQIVTEQRQQPAQMVEEQNVPQDEEINLKASLREMFAGTTVMGDTAPSGQPRAPRHFTNNPVLNQILNETTPDLRQREGMVGMAAMAGGYQSALGPMAAPMMPMENTPEPAFMRNVPPPPMGGHAPMPMQRPSSTIMSESHIPMAEIPQGVSALDVARQVPLAQPVAQALTKNYSQMMKLIDKKRGKA